MHVLKMQFLLTIIIGWITLVGTESPPIINHGGVANQATTDSIEVNLLIEKADSLSAVGDLQDEKIVLQQALKEAKNIDNRSLITAVQLDLAVNYINSQQADSAEVILTNTLNQKITDVDSTRIFNLLGIAYRYQGKFNQALEKHQLANARIDSAMYPMLFGKIKFNTGVVYSAKGEYGIALKYYLSGIKAAEAAGDSSSLARALNSVGLTYNDYGQPDKAQYYLQRAIRINKERNDRLGLLRATNNFANSYKDQGNYDEAITHYERALELHEEVRPDVPPFRILYNLGQLYKDIGELNKAENYYQESLAYCEEAGILQGLIYNYGGLANVAELRNNFDEARQNYISALDVANQISAGGLQKKPLESLYRLEKNIGNFDQALAYYEQYVALDDSLDEVAREQELAQTQERFNLRQEKETTRLLQENQIQQQARIHTQNWLIAAGIVIIAIILLSLGYVYRTNKEREKANVLLSTQHRELEEINAVKDKMMAIIAHDLRSPLATMKGVIYLIKEGKLSDREIQDVANELDSSINQNISMIDNLLVWAQSQMEGLSLNKKAIEAHKVVEDVFQNHTLKAHKKDVQLVDKVNERHKVFADHNLLKLILRNLVSNSIKFCNAGDSVTVSTEDESNNIRFDVADTGIGISQNALDKLFTAEGNSRKGTDNEKGSGLGLQLCKEFVEQQNGTIMVQGKEGQGTTVSFTLPKA